MRTGVWRVSLVVAVATLALALDASASSLVVDRGLPTININNAVGADRSNVTWASDKQNGFVGDDFSFGVAGQKYVVDSITVWGAQYNPLSLDIDNISLYLGESGGALAKVSTGSVSGNSNSNPNITHTYVTYVGGLEYQGNSGGFYPICETTFSGLNFVVEGGLKYNFGVVGDKYLWWSHASNAALSGSPQDGADGKYLDFSTADLSLATVVDSFGNGWDKSSDINVRVYASPVPLPAAAWMGLSLLGVGGIRGIKNRMRRHHA